MVKRSIMISTRWDLSIIDDLEKLIKSPTNPDAKFKDASKAIRECTKVGMKVHNYQEMMKDPKKSEEFREKMQTMLQNEEVFEWVATLSPDQIDGFLMALQMERDNRFKVTKLV